MAVLESLVEAGFCLVKSPPPAQAENLTRQFMRPVDGVTALKRDELQKLLRGTGVSPADFVERGWCYEDKRVFYPTAPLAIPTLGRANIAKA